MFSYLLQSLLPVAAEAEAQPNSRDSQLEPKRLSRPSFPSLPPDLTDLIIDHVALELDLSHCNPKAGSPQSQSRKDALKETLCACTLVCQTWLPRSRYHLLARTTIRINRVNVDKFLELLGSPVCTLIPALIEPEDGTRRQGTCIPSVLLSFSGESSKLATALIPLLSGRNTTVSELIVFGEDLTSSYCGASKAWNPIVEAWSHSVTYLSLQTSAEPLAGNKSSVILGPEGIVSSFTNLERLELVGAWEGRPATAHGRMRNLFPNGLKHLHLRVRSLRQVLSWFLQPPGIPLTSLHLSLSRFSDVDADNMQDFLKSLSSTLTSLRIAVTSRCLDHIPALPPLPALHTLHLELPFTRVDDNPSNDADRRDMWTSTLGIHTFLKGLIGQGSSKPAWMSSSVLASRPDDDSDGPSSSSPLPSLKVIHIFAPSYIYILARTLQQRENINQTMTIVRGTQSNLDIDIDKDGWDILDQLFFSSQPRSTRMTSTGLNQLQLEEIILEIDPKLLNSLDNGTGEEEDHEPSRLGSAFVQVDVDKEEEMGDKGSVGGAQVIKLVTGRKNGVHSSSRFKPKARTVNVAEKLTIQLQELLPKWLHRCTAHGVKVKCAYREVV